MVGKKLAALCLGLIVFAHAPVALATCSTIAQPEAVNPGLDPAFARRFQSIITLDKFADAAERAKMWQSFLADAKAAGFADPLTLARAHAWLAYSLEYSDQADAALPEALAAKVMVDKGGLAGKPVDAEVLAILSMIETDAGKGDAGRKHGDEALALARKLFGEESAEASLAYNATGTSAYAQGRYADAEHAFGRASDLAAKCLPPGDPFIVNQMASHAGTLYMVGQIEEALVVNQRAANWALTNLPEDNPTITLALGNLGTLLHAVGRDAEAEVAMRKVVDLEARYQAESWFYRAISLSNFAAIVDAQGRHEVAETLWLRSMEFHQKATIKRDPITPAYPLRYAADAAQARGDLGLALARRKQAAAMIDTAAPTENSERARTHLELANTMVLAGQAKAALPIAEPAINLIRSKLGEADTKRMSSEIAYARIIARNGRSAEAYQLARGVAQRLEKTLLDSATSRRDLVRFGPAFSASFSVVTELALANNQHEDAFHYLQLANLSDVVLVTSEVAARAAANNPASSAMIRAFQDLLRQRQLLDRERSTALASADPAQIKANADAIAANDLKITEIGAELDRIAPEFRSLGRPAPVTLAEYRARLKKGQVLLAPLPLDDGTLAIAVSREGLVWQKVPARRWQIENLVQRLRRSLDPQEADAIGGFDYAAARALYRAIAPARLAPTLASHRDVVWYTSGALASVPPAVLVSSAKGKAPRWLIHDHSVAIAASLQAHSPGEPNGKGGGMFLGVGAPDLDGPGLLPGLQDLPDLPGAAQELRKMADALGPGRARILAGSDANELTIKTAKLGDYSVIAFATHGLVNGEIAGVSEPALVLSAPGANPGEGNDGVLTASEIARLSLNADWVILSACNTASGETRGGASFGGLASAFIHAGARALLVSHWPVRDDAAAFLSTRTLALNASGLSRAEALRRAMLELMGKRMGQNMRGGDPSIWAPFVVIEP